YNEEFARRPFLAQCHEHTTSHCDRLHAPPDHSGRSHVPGTDHLAPHTELVMRRFNTATLGGLLAMIAGWLVERVPVWLNRDSQGRQKRGVLASDSAL